MSWPERPDVPESGPDLPLWGLKVLDLSRIVAGPFATMILSDLGADVIKVERPGEGDETRRWGPPFHGETSAYFMAVNRNKRSLTVDLTTPEGQDIVTELARAADVVLDNYLPAQAARLGLDAMKSATQAVWVSVRAAGSDGPDGDKPGVDAAVQARSGLMSVNGNTGTGATKMGVPIVDIVSGLYAVVAALAGLWRLQPARAARIEVPLLECGVSALLNQAANYLIGGQIPGPSGNDHPNLVPYGPFPTADGQVFLAATSDLQFQRLCEALGLAELASSAKFASNQDRLEHRQELVAILSETTGAATTAEWIRAAQRIGALAAPINSVPEALDHDAHIGAVDLVQTVVTDAGPARLVGSPLLVDGHRPKVRTSPPRIGEHTEEILTALGYDAHDVARLHQGGVC